MNLAAYARYSSDNQKAESIEEQFREIDDWAKRTDNTIVTRYSDYALSGKFDYRPQFDQMLKDSAGGTFDGVVVFDLSRFSRGGEYGLIDELKLKECGVLLLSATESYGDDFGGKLVKHIKFLMAEEKINELRVNVARGQRDNAIKCKHNGGIPPLGYDVGPDGTLVINDREAAAVRLIFEMYADRRPYRDICSALNKKGFKTKRNCNDFGKNSIHEILINKKYIGYYEFGRIKRVKLRQTSADTCKSKTIEADDYVSIDGGCPAIVTRELWDKVQSMKVKREVFNPKAKVEYLLKGKVYCGVCGSPYWGDGASKRYLNDYYYVCSGRKSKKACTNRKVSKVLLEEEVTAQVRAMLFSAQGKEQLKKYIFAVNESSRNVDENAIKEYEDKVKVIESRIARAQEAYISGVIELDALRRIKQCEEQKKRELVPPSDGQVLDITDDRLERIMTKLEKTLSEDKDLIATLVDKIIIIGDKIDVYIYKNFLSDTKTNNDAGSLPASSVGDCVVEIRRHRDYPRKLLIVNNNIVVSFLMQKEP